MIVSRANLFCVVNQGAGVDVNQGVGADANKGMGKPCQPGRNGVIKQGVASVRIVRAQNTGAIYRK